MIARTSRCSARVRAGTCVRSAPAILRSSRSVPSLAGDERARRSTRDRTRVSKVRPSSTPKIAIARRPATLETALLTPEATPACRGSTAPITVVVSGATVTAMPNPSMMTAGKNVVQYEPPIPGRAYRASPSAAIPGPTVSGRRLPIRATRLPDQRDESGGQRHVTSGRPGLAAGV